MLKKQLSILMMCGSLMAFSACEPEAGDPGLPGTNGIAGKDGKNGTNGPVGDKGLAGAKGATGNKGPIGDQGKAGVATGWIPVGSWTIIEERKDSDGKIISVLLGAKVANPALSKKVIDNSILFHYLKTPSINPITQFILTNELNDFSFGKGTLETYSEVKIKSVSEGQVELSVLVAYSPAKTAVEFKKILDDDKFELQSYYLELK